MGTEKREDRQPHPAPTSEGGEGAELETRTDDVLYSFKTVFNQSPAPGHPGIEKSSGNNNKPRSDQSSLICVHTNIDMLNKRAELQALMTLHIPDVLGISEVKPKNSRYPIQKSEVTLEGYELFHNLESPGRGICLCVRERLRPSLCTTIQTNTEEAILVECQLKDKVTLLLGQQKP